MIRLLFLALSLSAFAQDMELFLLIGQSNMAGRGVIEEQDRTPFPRVFTLTKEETWVPAVEPIHFDRPDRLGTGLGRSFARALAEAAPTAKIGLIPAAMGGSALDEWIPGGKLYTDAVRRAKVAMKNGKLRGILWHQGEADSLKLDLARSYQERWLKVMKALRAELGDVPVVVGELGQFLYTRDKNDYPYARIINEQLAMLAVNGPRVAFVSSQGLGHKGDILHFDSAGLREFGRRYAHAFLMLDGSWK
ncbi:MAG TPA: sialate O-acetylesterase [Bryobacteraceae bacterium]|nr:sialate O-acetylesterase [Bryobacteraceae bacterium]